MHAKKKKNTRLNQDTLCCIWPLCWDSQRLTHPLSSRCLFISTSPLRTENVIPFVSVALNVFFKPLSPKVFGWPVLLRGRTLLSVSLHSPSAIWESPSLLLSLGLISFTPNLKQLSAHRNFSPKRSVSITAPTGDYGIKRQIRKQTKFTPSAPSEDVTCSVFSLTACECW